MFTIDHAALLVSLVAMYYSAVLLTEWLSGLDSHQVPQTVWVMKSVADMKRRIVHGGGDR